MKLFAVVGCFGSAVLSKCSVAVGNIEGSSSKQKTPGPLDCWRAQISEVQCGVNSEK